MVVLSEQAQDPGGLGTHTVFLQAPGFFFAFHTSVSLDVPLDGWGGSASTGG